MTRIKKFPILSYPCDPCHPWLVYLVLPPSELADRIFHSAPAGCLKVSDRGGQRRDNGHSGWHGLESRPEPRPQLEEAACRPASRRDCRRRRTPARGTAVPGAAPPRKSG